MQFYCDPTNILKGPRLFFKKMTITGALNTTTVTTALGTEYTLNGSVKFQIRAVCYDQKVCSSGSLMKATQLCVKLQSCNENCHSVVMCSESLKLHRFFQVEPASKAVESWHVIYNKMVDLTTWMFDLEMIYITNGVNESITGQLMMDVYNDEDTCDVKLVGVDGTVRAHGSILAAASPIMRAAFFGDFTEAREKQLKVPDASVAALKLLKKYVYTGFVDAEPAMLVTLLPIASRFLMTSLSHACAAALSALSPDDLIPLLQIDLKPTPIKPEEKPKPALLMIEMLTRIDDKLEALKINPENGAGAGDEDHSKY